MFSFLPSRVLRSKAGLVTEAGEIVDEEILGGTWSFEIEGGGGGGGGVGVFEAGGGGGCVGVFEAGGSGGKVEGGGGGGVKGGGGSGGGSFFLIEEDGCRRWSRSKGSDSAPIQIKNSDRILVCLKSDWRIRCLKSDCFG